MAITKALNALKERSTQTIIFGSFGIGLLAGLIVSFSTSHADGDVLQVVNTVIASVTMGMATWATLASQRSAEAARQALHSDRAWMTSVGAEAARFSGRALGVQVRHGIMVSLRWTNLGRSPSLNCIVFYDVFFT